uniref:4c protein n=1 Tax=Infectious bronchitis virus TaxID=11120 RepID=A0A1X9Y2W6_9GAMC|nr:4c protein [Infectious bronchitis virus]
MEKSTTKETPFSKKVVVGCGPKWIKPPTLLICNKGVWTYKNLTNTDDEMAD